MLQQSEIDSRYANLLLTMKESKLYWKVKNQLIQEILEKFNDMSQLKNSDIAGLSSQFGYEQQFKQLILNCASKYWKSEPIKSDQLDYLSQNRVKWTELLIKNFDFVNENMKNYSKAQMDQIDALNFYDWKSIFTFLISIQPPTSQLVNLQSKYSLINLNIPVPSYNELKNKYIYLSNPDNIEMATESQRRDRERRAAQIVDNEALETEIEQFACGGLPTGYRVDIYRKYFGLENSVSKMFQQNIEDYQKNPNLFDQVIEIDADDSSQDVFYFVFKESIQKIGQIFLRDKEILKKLLIYPIALDKVSLSDQSKIPVSGVIPCKNFTRYIQPFGYYSNKDEVVYLLFREFYCRYFCQLNSISSIPSGLLCLCIIFESLFQYSDNKIFMHMRSLQIDPLKIAFPWIFHSFIGYISVEELNLLFDRILGYKSLEILPAFAIGLFKNRGKQILQCVTAEQVEQLFTPPFNDNFLETIRNYFLI